MIFRTILDKYYDYRPFKSVFLNKIVGNGSKILGIIANVILPLQFKMSKPKDDVPVAKDTVITLTSFPKRIGKLWLVIECLLRQTLRAERIVVYLSKEQFPSKDLLPQKLLAYEKRKTVGFVLVDGDMRSYKKFWYALTDFPGKRLITVDDDILYAPTLIEKLCSATRNNSDCVVAAYCSWIGRDDKGNILPYTRWPKKSIKAGEKGFDVFFGSGGGALFPIGSLQGANQPYYIIKEICPLADDIWLNAWIRYNGFKVLNISRKGAVPDVLNLDNQTLDSVNNGMRLNDKQLSSVINYFQGEFGLNPFEYKKPELTSENSWLL